MKTVDIYTDGACSGNPGPGGYCAILIYGEHEKIVSGNELETTNNRMELLAVIKGIDCLKESCAILNMLLMLLIKIGFLAGSKMAGKLQVKNRLKISICGKNF